MYSRIISIALVEPLYQVNIGHIARVMKNFCVKNLYLVKPRCNYLGAKAIMYSKHAHDVLEHAKKVGSISEAARISRSNLVVGTTGIWRKSERSLYNIYTPSAFVKSHKGAKRMLLVLGRDDTGLTKKELEECDAVVAIAANPAYPVLNISHALAILLYEFTGKDMSPEYSIERMLASESTKESIYMLFKKLVYSNKRIRNKKAVLMAFRHMLNRSLPREKELRALAVALSTK
ncbi:MAG: RNA methyltransferase [Candidatus Micrarchaeia archaeon]